MPERFRLTEECDARLRVGGACRRNEPEHPGRVELVPFEPNHVPGRLRDDARGAQQLAELRDRVLE